MCSRRIALDILRHVAMRRIPLDAALEQASQDLQKLTPPDRGFVRMLASTALRRHGQCNGLIAKFCDRPVDAQLRLILTIGITQILFMDVPDHAGVSTSVDLCKNKAQKGFVNAVLRNVIRAEQNDLPDIAQNTPSWMRNAWEKDYGAEIAHKIMAAHLSEAPTDFSAKNPDAWAEALEADIMPTGTLRRNAGGAIHGLPGYDEGAWWVQDLSASLPVKLLGDVNDRHVLDLCAAPGGKTAQLCALGAKVIAVDRSESRMKRLSDNMDRLKFAAQVKTQIADLMQWEPAQKFTHILLDAPCSATGTIRRNPDILLLKTQDDMHKLAALQAALLDRALSWLEPDGVLIYCTCSLQKEEGENQTASLPNIPIKPDEIGHLPGIDDRGNLRILPFYLEDRGGMDGFYIARLTKRG